MRVAMVVPEMGSGGAEALVEQSARHLVAAGHDVLVISSGGWRAEALSRDGVAVAEVPMRGRAPHDLIRGVLRLRRVLRAHRPDVVHAHNVKAAGLVVVALVGRRTPVLVTAHGFPPASYAPAARVLQRAADLVVAVSGDVADRLRAEGLRRPIEVIENALVPLAVPERGAARAELDLAAEERVVLCLARMTEQKRQDLLIEALADRHDLTLLIAGSGPTRERLEAHAQQRGAVARFLGDRDDAPRLIGAADLLVLPSDWEGLPVTLLEAMGAGLPVVASAVGGVATLEGAVALVEPGSAAALGETIDRVLDDPAYADRLRAGARDLLAARFDPATMLRRYDAAYARLGSVDSTPARADAGHTGDRTEGGSER